MLNLLEYEIIAKLMGLHWQADAVAAVNERFDDLMPANSDAFSNPQGVIPLGRNQVCFCGSGEKYKNCHGRLV